MSKCKYFKGKLKKKVAFVWILLDRNMTICDIITIIMEYRHYHFKNQSITRQIEETLPLNLPTMNFCILTKKMDKNSVLPFNIFSFIFIHNFSDILEFPPMKWSSSCLKSRQTNTNTNTCLTLIIISNYQHAIFYTVIVSWNCYSTKEETSSKSLFHVFPPKRLFYWFWSFVSFP